MLTRFLLLMLACSLAAPAGEPPAVSAPAPAVIERLARFDGIFAGTLDWFIQLYDPQVGGFSSSIEMARSPQHGPDLQSTCQVLAGLRQGGLMEAMPEPMRRAIAAYLQSNQDQTTGIFWDHRHPKVLDQRRDRIIARTTGFALAWLPRVGAEPRHPVPGSEPERLPEHLQSLTAWNAWLKKTLGDQPGYGVLDDLGSQATFLMRMGEAQRKPYVEAAVRYVNAKQDAVTGLWIGSSATHQQEPLDGAFKYVLFLKQVGEPVPRADRIKDSIFAWFRAKDGQTVDNTCFVCNPIRLLVDILPYLKEGSLPDEQQVSLIDWHTRHLQPFVQKDGGLSRFLNVFHLAVENHTYGRATGPQGDVNGNAQALVARSMLYQLAGMDTPPLPKADGFWERFQRRHPHAFAGQP